MDEYAQVCIYEMVGQILPRIVEGVKNRLA